MNSCPKNAFVDQTCGTGVVPTNPFKRFEKHDVEQSIASRFEQEVNQYSGRLAIKDRDNAFSYDALNRMANRIARAILARDHRTAQHAYSIGL